MKFIILTVALFAMAYARPEPPVSQQYQQKQDQVPILRYDNEGVNFDGSYKYGFETGNGISQEESGQLKQVQGENEPVLEVQGKSSWTADDGTPVNIFYIANENGYQPQGDILPTPPPIPPAIQKLLEYIAAHPEENEGNKPNNKQY